MKNIFLISAVLLAIVFSSCQNEQKKPNILFILVDDLGWNDLGCYGSTFYESPNIDKLASSAIMFTDAYAGGTVCSPTRAALMTGKHPARLGITDWIPGAGDKNKKLKTPGILNELPLEEYTMAEAFRDDGYKTFFAGKWHLGDEGFFPEDQGFDINIGGNHTGSPRGGYYSPYKNPQLEDGPKGEYLTDRLTNETIKFIENSLYENPDKPFFAYLSFYTVHSPIQGCKRYIQKFKEKARSLPTAPDSGYIAEHSGWTKTQQNNPRYASMVYAMDENVGRLMRRLKELKIDDNTIVIFTSDNGGLSTLYRKGAPTSLAPLRAGKGWCYEGGIRIPLIIKIPGEEYQGKVINEPVVSMDLYPTLVDLAEIHPMPEQYVDGVDLLPAIEGEKLNRKSLFWHYPQYHGSAWTPGASIRQGDWVLVEFYEPGVKELYNLKDDIGERNNLASQYPQKVDSMLKQLRKMQKKSKAKFPVLREEMNR
jgi:arylsulfatase A-like enzyme